MGVAGTVLFLSTLDSANKHRLCVSRWGLQAVLVFEQTLAAALCYWDSRSCSCPFIIGIHALAAALCYLSSLCCSCPLLPLIIGIHAWVTIRPICVMY
jgi:hypothetical protein